ncbi:MAG: acyltransferase [Bacteroidetes bacterium]|nr:acyltransferase [Bacteroidota bacterium]
MKIRHHFLDWVRVMAFLLLILYHTGMFFNTWGWHFKNPVTSGNFEIWMSLVNPWRLSLLFFVSGAGASFATRSRSLGSFAKERITRLLIPLIFGMLVIVPPQIYLERVVVEGYTGSYLSFYAKVFEFKAYPEGNFSWHHLWFVVYLLVFSLLAIPLFRILKNRQILSTRWSTVLIILPLSLCYFLLRDRWPTTHNLVADWFNFTFSFLIFLIGYLFGNQADIWERLEQKRYLNLGFGIFLIVFNIVHDAILGPLSEEILWVKILNSVFKIAFIFCIILAILGFAKKYLNFENSFIKYSNRAVYPFYILHQTVILMLGYYGLDWQINLILKFFLMATSTLLICWGLYHFLIKNYKVTRLLFGVK